MFNRNEIWAGLLFGILFPALGFIALYEIFSFLEMKGAASGAGFSPNFRERTVAVIAIALNIIPMNIFRRRRWDLSMRGIVIATTVLAFVWVFRYSLSLF